MSEENKVEETKAEETKAEETKAEETKAEEPKAEEPKAEETKAEETKAEEPKAEEPKAEEPKAEEPKAEEPKAEESKAEENKPAEKKDAKGKSKKTKIIVGVIIGVVALFLVLILIIVGIVLLVNRSKSIKINDYVTVEFEGYNEVGEAHLNFDTYEFNRDIEGVKVRTSNYKKYLMAQKGYSSRQASEHIYVMKESGLIESEVRDLCCNGTLSKSSDLSNGETIYYESNIDVDLVEELYKVKIKEDEKKNEFVVAGLEVVPTFDPFEYLEVEFSGFAPDGQIRLNKTSFDGEAGYFDFYADRYDGLSNGDVVTIKCELLTSDKLFVERFECLPNAREKQYTVEGLLSYVLNSADIPADTMALMKSQAESAIASKFANWYEYGSNTDYLSARSVASTEYIGNYFLVAKDGNRSRGNNICYLVYRINTAEDMVAYKGTEVVENAISYVAIGFYDLAVEDSGVGNVDISRYDFMYENWSDPKPYPYSRYSNFKPTIYGYQSLDMLYNDAVTKKVEDYNYENNVTE